MEDLQQDIFSPIVKNKEMSNASLLDVSHVTLVKLSDHRWEGRWNGDRDCLYPEDAATGFRMFTTMEDTSFAWSEPHAKATMPQRHVNLLLTVTKMHSPAIDERGTKPVVKNMWTTKEIGNVAEKSKHVPIYIYIYTSSKPQPLDCLQVHRRI